MGTLKMPMPTVYASGKTHWNYVCGTCGITGVKLWREYQTFLNHQELTCAVCGVVRANARKHDEGPLLLPDADGRTYREKDSHKSKGDQLGWLIPAVPNEEGDTFWGYTSVPAEGVTWWKSLPTLKVAQKES